MRALKNIDVAFIPMNLPYTMTPAEAADAVKAFKPKVAIPYHYKGQDVEVFKKALEGSAVDFHVHQDPDSAPRAIDADDVARQAKAAGMRAVVLKNHWAETASLAYMVHKIVPGFDALGGITQDLAIGGINIEAVKHMADMKGGYGRVVWLPTFDAENNVKVKGPFVRVSEIGKLLPSVLALLDYVATRKQLMLETGHVSA